MSQYTSSLYSPKKDKRMDEQTPQSPILLALAGIGIEVYPVHAQFLSQKLAGYGAQDLPADAPWISVRMSPEDIYAEKEYEAVILANYGLKVPDYEDGYFEMVSLFRKLLDRMLDWNIIYMHGSAVCIDGSGVLFTAPSGTGKSTHARLWREHFKDRVVVINDDKPLIRISGDGIFVCGNPWNGKHGIGCQMEAPLRAVVRLRRGQTNSVRPVDTLEAMRDLYKATFHFQEKEKMQKVLPLLGDIMINVPCCRMDCTMDPEAAEVSYAGIAEALQLRI